jgi:hypothetical protein
MQRQRWHGQRYKLEAVACIGRAWRQTEQTELVSSRQTDQNVLEVGRAVRPSECVASG